MRKKKKNSALHIVIILFDRTVKNPNICLFIIARIIKIKSSDYWSLFNYISFVNESKHIAKERLKILCLLSMKKKKKTDLEKSVYY